jgi:hypothetical protein
VVTEPAAAAQAAAFDVAVEGQPVKADDLARWVAAFQVDSEGVRYMQSGPPPAWTAVGRSRGYV